jgi:adenine-specific DNA-methyltransferase
MAKKKNNAAGDGLKNVEDYRHKGAKRKNNPPAKIAAEGTVPVVPKIEYSYSPRRPPVLRFDTSGAADKLPELLAQARKRKLTDEEVRLLAEALRTQEPWLEWTGKSEAESKGFSVDPVALHIHERISAQAILKIAARQDVKRTLFADPEQGYHEAVQFYQHNIDWTNRLILGDSVHVMASLAHREDLAGKVQMIYMDPPYGIKYGSNFQPHVGRRDVSDKEKDLTRELEMVKAYRDTWHIGIHSYLTYLRERLIIAKELLADSGSIFVQIGAANVHRVRLILDEVFGPDQFISLITVRKTATPSNRLDDGAFYLLWYCRDAERVKFKRVFVEKPCDEWARDTPGGSWCVEIEGIRRKLRPKEKANTKLLPSGSKVYCLSKMTSAGAATTPEVFDVFGQSFSLNPNEHWKTGPNGRRRLVEAGRVELRGRPWFTKFYEDGQFKRMNNVWEDTAGKSGKSLYVVQTQIDVVGRCMLMTTEPGDLVLDPTCGSGTTACIAEQWGRRWITIDTSRVAIAIARQRILTSKYEYYQLRAVTTDEQARNPRCTWLTDPQQMVQGQCTFLCNKIPHITLKSIAQNSNLDPIFAKYRQVLDELLAVCNTTLANVNQEVRRILGLKLLNKEKKVGKKAITDAERRRWQLPEKGKNWEHWTVPFDTDSEWTKELTNAITAYRKAWRAKMDEIDACIAANAAKAELVHQPEVVKGIVRVSGPFTVEAVQPPEMSLAEFGKTPIGGAPERLDNFEVKNVQSYLDQMVRLLNMDGVRYPDNKESKFGRLKRILGNDGCIHAEGRWALSNGEEDSDPDGKATVAVAFGPQYGPVTAKQIKDLIQASESRGYEDLVVAGFSFDGPAQERIDEAKIKFPTLRVHIAHIRPDVNPAMDGLLKQKPGSQLFTVFGQPRTKPTGPDSNGEYQVIMEGVDIYDPVANAIRSTEGQKVAAWFIDGDYDGQTFCVTQAFFPDKSAWKKLTEALGGLIDPKRFKALSGTVSLPFPPGKHKCVAVKVIDSRGNEVMQVHKLG